MLLDWKLRAICDLMLTLELKMMQKRYRLRMYTVKLTNGYDRKFAFRFIYSTEAKKKKFI